MTNEAGSLFAEYWAANPTATAREAGEHGIAHMTRMIKEGKYQQGADFINAWMDEFTKASRARTDAALPVFRQSVASTLSTARTASALPMGISSGKLTAIVAGIGLAAAAYYVTRTSVAPNGKDSTKPARWTDYVHQRRTAGPSQEAGPGAGRDR
jgi:hypothetical protein